MAAANPCLRAEVSIIEQTFRGERSYVVKDSAAQKYFRFGAVEVRVMRCFDGTRSAGEIAAALAAEGMRISAAAVEGFARKLAGAGFLERTIEERSTLQLERLRAERHRRRRSALFRGELLRMRWSFGDPDAMLGRTLPALRWMFTPAFCVVSALLFGGYLLLLGQQWTAFSADVAAAFSLHAIGLGDIALLWVVSGTVILIHELGHAYTCKHFGGEVRELGFMLLYFQPAFYCNVTDAWSFPERRARLWVTAAGSWIQLVVASVAAFVWWGSAPGTLVSHAAIAAMLIGGLTTLFTNANPLLPLDGYFALTDWLEIPNLRHRALAHFAWWVRRRVFRLEIPEPSVTARERRVFLTYGVLAFAYIALVFAFVASIVLGWAGRAFGTLGVVVVLAAILALARGTIVEWSRTAAMSFRTLRGAWRGRWRKTGIVAGSVALVVLLMPWTLAAPGFAEVHPLTTRAVTATDSASVERVLVAEGQRVDAGAPMVRLIDRGLDMARLAALRTVDSLTVAQGSALAAGRAGDAVRLDAERVAAAAQLAALEVRASRLVLRAPAAGVVATPRPEDLVGRHVDEGDTLLVVAALDSVEVRVALTGGGATRVRAGQPIHLVSYADVAHPWSGRVGEVSVAGAPAGAAEARVRLPASAAWRAGVRGEASVDLRRSTIFGALLWNARRRIRGDLWL